MYRILQGVRRAVAARDAGRFDLPAVVCAPGSPDVFGRVRLDELFSPKDVVARDHRYIRNTEYPTRVLGTEPPPITVTPTTPAVAARLTPIFRVRLI